MSIPILLWGLVFGFVGQLVNLLLWFQRSVTGGTDLKTKFSIIRFIVSLMIGTLGGGLAALTVAFTPDIQLNQTLVMTFILAGFSGAKAFESYVQITK